MRYDPKHRAWLEEAKRAFAAGKFSNGPDNSLQTKVTRHLLWEASTEFTPEEMARLDEVIRDYRFGKAEVTEGVASENSEFAPSQFFVPKESGQKVGSSIVLPGMLRGLSENERAALFDSFNTADKNFGEEQVKALEEEFREQEAEISRLREGQSGKGRK